MPRSLSLLFAANAVFRASTRSTCSDVLTLLLSLSTGSIGESAMLERLVVDRMPLGVLSIEVDEEVELAS